MATLSPVLRLHRQMQDIASALAARPDWTDDAVMKKTLMLHAEWVSGLRTSSLLDATQALAQWAEWSQYLPSGISPVSPEGVEHFLSHLQSLGKSDSTICLKFSYVRRFLAGIGAVTAAEAARVLISGYWGSLSLRPRKSRALINEEIEIMLALVDVDDARQVQDAALLLVLYEGPARIGELLGTYRQGCWDRPPIAVSDLALHPDDTAMLRLSTLRDPGVDTVHLSPRCGRFLRRWIELAGIDSGYLFRSFVHARIDRISKRPLLSETAAKRLKDWVRCAGLRVDGLSLESPRMGLATDLLRTANNMDDLLGRTRWETPTALFRALNVLPHPQGSLRAQRGRAACGTGYRRKPALGSPQQSFTF